MRYTKIALLVFGLGLVLGLAVIAAELRSLERVASGLMAFAIAAVPIGMLTDWRRAVMAAKPAPKKRAKAPARRAAPRTRKSAGPKR